MLGGITERIDQNGKSGFPILENIPLIQYLFSRETTQSERKSVMYLLTPRSYKENLQQTKQYFEKGEDTLDRPNLTELENRHKDWYDPDSNHALILRDLAPIYRDFRAGDFLPLFWHQKDGVDETLTKIVDFLWY
jgi:general secretion pathway protein D